MPQLILNAAQCEALSWYFDSENEEGGDQWHYGEPVDIEVDRGILVINGAYLHKNGEWATFHPHDFTMKIFIVEAMFRTDQVLGIVAEFKGNIFKVEPDGEDRVRVVGDQGETLGRITFRDGRLVEA